MRFGRPFRATSGPARHQRGLGTLTMCVVLLAILGLGATWGARQLASAQRVAANDLRGVAAAEAAEAGLAWTLAMLNTGRIDDRCRPAATFTTTTTSVVDGDFRERFLRISADGDYQPTATTDWLAHCINTGALRWTCRCGSSSSSGNSSSESGGNDPPPAPSSADAQPFFSMRFSDTGVSGLLRLVVRGCSDLGGALATDCEDLSDGPRGIAEVSQQLALLSALRHPPSTALTEGQGAFVRVFGMPPARYRSQPAVTRLRCGTDCGTALAQALARGRRLLWIDGDASLGDLPAEAIGDQPLVLIAAGRLELSSSTSLQGVLYARDGLRWHPPAGVATTLRGALVSDGTIDHGPGVTPVHDPEVLQRIHRRMGSFLPVPGSWTPTR